MWYFSMCGVAIKKKRKEALSNKIAAFKVLMAYSSYTLVVLTIYLVHKLVLLQILLDLSTVSLNPSGLRLNAVEGLS